MNPFAHISAALLFASWLPASDQLIVDADLPQPLDASFVQELVTHSPFTRSVDLEDSLQLTGIAYVDGRPVATFFNKATRQSVVVSEESNAQGWRLTHAAPGVELADTEVELMIGPETITVRYGAEQLSPGSGKKGVPTTYVAKSGESSSKADKSFRVSSYLGDGDRERYASLSPDARDKFKALVKSHLDKRPELTQAQSAAYAQKVFAKIQAADHKSAGTDSGLKSPKNGKSIKKKQTG